MLNKSLLNFSDGYDAKPMPKNLRSIRDSHLRILRLHQKNVNAFALSVDESANSLKISDSQTQL